MNHQWTHKVWTDTECESLIEANLPEFLPVYLSFPPGILRADIFRIAVLYVKGGVYADLDMECLRPLDDLLEHCAPGAAEVLLARDHPCHERKHYGGRVMWLNAFMIAKPKARFLGLALDEIARQSKRKFNPADPVQVTGPGLLTRIVELASNNLAALGIKEMPWQWVHPLPHINEGLKETAKYKTLIKTGQWREGRQVPLLHRREDFNPWGEPPYAAHYWWHSYIENCREVNMLTQNASRLLQSDGEIVERRLNALQAEDIASLTVPFGEALCEMAERGGRTIGISSPLWKSLSDLVGKVGAGLGWLPVEVDDVTSPSSQPHDLLLLSTEDGCHFELAQAAPGLLQKRGLLTVRSAGPEDMARMRRAGFREVSPYPRLLEAVPGPQDEIPHLIHSFAPDFTSSWQRLSASSWKAFLEADWRIMPWTPESIVGWAEINAPEYAPLLKDYPSDEHRLLAGRWIVLSKLGGVTLPSHLIMTRPLGGMLRWKQLLFESRRHADGRLGASSKLVASCADHPFWRGLSEALETLRHKPLSEAAGAAFFEERARMSLHFMGRSQWPSIMEPDSLVFRPASKEWTRLVRARHWGSLNVMYPSYFLDPTDE